jgi:hypothetical protein
LNLLGQWKLKGALEGVILWLTYKQWTDVQASGKGGCHLRGKNEEKGNVFFTLLLFLPLCCVIFAEFILELIF